MRHGRYRRSSGSSAASACDRTLPFCPKSSPLRFGATPSERKPEVKLEVAWQHGHDTLSRPPD